MEMWCQRIIPWRMPNFLPYVVIHCMESVANFTYSSPRASKSWEKNIHSHSQEVFIGTGANNHRSASQDPFSLAEINPDLCDGSEPEVPQQSQECTWKPRSELPEIHWETKRRLGSPLIPYLTSLKHPEDSYNFPTGRGRTRGQRSESLNQAGE